MDSQHPTGGIDRFRIVAALLIVAIHIPPLTGVPDFILSHVLARVAVPFFLMTTGYFVLPGYLFGDRSGTGALPGFFRKTALLYAGATLLYLPLSIYAGYYAKGELPATVLRNLLFDGTFYHLWYLPAAMLGAALLWALSRKLPGRAVLAVSLLLYLIGLLGDSYYGLTEKSAALSSAYGALFSVFSYTRNGLFYAPLFLCLGAYLRSSGPRLSRGKSTVGLLTSLAAMLSEGLLLRALGWQRHDSMYLLLPFCMVFLFSLLLTFNVKADRRLRTVSLWIYLLHPLLLVILRGFAGVTGLESLLVENRAVSYASVCLLSAGAAVLIFHYSGRKKPAPAEGSRAWVELDMGALRHNVSLLRSLLPESCRLMPAVKANAYGHGAVPIARELSKLGVRDFCVASAREGVQLRRAGVRGDILILGYTSPAEIPLLRRYHLIQTVVDAAYAGTLNAFEKPLRVHIKLDTGMRRLGEPSENLPQIMKIFEYKNLCMEGVYTHLCADDTVKSADREFTFRQAEAFRIACDEIRSRGYEIPKTHILSSYGVINYPQLHSDYARVGIALFGMLSTREDTARCGLDLRPVLSAKARVAAVKNLRRGESAGYGLAFTADRDMRIAVLSAGYADGLPRGLSCGVGSVLIAGRRAPIVGRICMDQTVVDVTEIPKAAQGDEAVLIGRSGTEEITACELAEKTGTIANEILSRLGPRLTDHPVIRPVGAPARDPAAARHAILPTYVKTAPDRH